LKSVAYCLACACMTAALATAPVDEAAREAILELILPAYSVEFRKTLEIF